MKKSLSLCLTLFVCLFSTPCVLHAVIGDDEDSLLEQTKAQLAAIERVIKSELIDVDTQLSELESDIAFQEGRIAKLERLLFENQGRVADCEGRLDAYDDFQASNELRLQILEAKVKAMALHVFSQDPGSDLYNLGVAIQQLDAREAVRHVADQARLTTLQGIMDSLDPPTDQSE